MYRQEEGVLSQHSVKEGLSEDLVRLLILVEGPSQRVT